MNKKLIAAGISCLLAISTAITSFAATGSSISGSGGGLNGGGSGSSTQPSTIEYISSMHAYQINNGIQCSIVRKDNGQLVSNVITMNSYIPMNIPNAPDGDLKNHWFKYENRTGIFNKKKQIMYFLNGAKTDDWFTITLTDIKNPSTTGGIHYINHETGLPEPGKMYTYADIETALKEFLNNYYTVKHPEYADTYNNAGGSPIDHSGTYKSTGVEKNISGPVELKDGRNMATGNKFRAQMNTKLPDGSIVLQRFLGLEMTKRDSIGTLHENETEYLFHFTDSQMQNRLEELRAQGADMPIVQVMKEFNLYVEFEAVAWQVNEVTDPKAPDGYNETGYTNKNFWNTPYIYYGTPKLVTYRTARDFMEYLYNPDKYQRAYDPNPTAFRSYLGQIKSQMGNYSPDANDWFNSFLSYAKNNGVGQAWDWSLAYQAYTIERSEPQMGLKTFADLGLDATTIDQTVGPTMSFWFEHMDDLGYGLMLFNPEPDGSTSTFDEINYSSSSTNGYRPGPSEDKSKDGGTEAKNNIVKFYATKTGDSYVYTENHTRSNTVGSITLEDEEGYVIDNWYTSSTFKEPTSKTDSYDNWKSSMENKQTGNKTGTTTLAQGETLYLRLVEAPVVIKVYETGGNVDKVTTDTNPKFDNNKLIVTTPDNGYTYTEGVKSNTKKDVKDWSEVPSGTPTTDTNIPLSPNEKVVYLHYYKDPAEAGLVLHENEISHQFGLSDVKGYLIDGIRKYSSVSVSGSCPEDVGDDDDYERCGDSYDYQHSDNWTYTIENQPSYNTQFVWRWLQTDQKSYTGNDLSESGGEGHSTPDMKMILQRSISDKATLYPGLNKENTQTLKEMGLQGESYTPAGQRNGGADQPSRKTWSETFNTNWQFTAHNTPTAYFATDHGYTDTDTHSNTGNEGELNSNYSQSGNTTVYGLWGKANDGIASVKSLQANTDKWQYSGLKFTGLKNHTSETICSFYPYYRMKYISELDNSEKDAYLTSENLSRLINTSRVDMSMFKSKSGLGLKLSSTQWSIHSGAQKLLSEYGIADKDSLLPAGAIYNLSSSSTDNTIPDCWIGARIFQTYIPDKAVLVDATGILNKSEAEAKITAFKQQMDKVLDNYEVVMMGLEGIEANPTNFDKKSVQITGKEGKYKLGREFNRDKKYDLQTGSSGADRSDLDIIGRADEGIIDWGFKADVDGNITITKNGSQVEVINKTQKVSSNAEVKDLNAQTKILDNFISALDRNLGSDRTGKSWYNEGFEVHVLENKYAVQLGFDKEHEPVRGNALNIQANGTLDSRQDMFNGDENTITEKARTYRFQVSPRTTLAEGGSHNVGWIGNFGDVEIFVPGIQGLMQSKLFITSNTTVMDLN